MRKKEKAGEFRDFRKQIFVDRLVTAHTSK